jgi:transposase
VDECEIHTHPGLAKVWQRREHPVKVPAAGEDHKVVVLGALDYASGRLVWQISPQKNGEEFAHFLDTLVTTFPEGAVIVVLDNVGYHKSHALRDQWRRIADRVTPFWLPAYAPQLNLIERVWRWLKAKIANHRWWNDLDRLAAASTTLLASIEGHFHAINGPSFQLAQNFYSSAWRNYPYRYPQAGDYL